MKYVLVLVTIAAVTGCASDPSRSNVNAGAIVGAARTDPSEHTLYCPDSPIDCRKMAREQCGEAGYTRIIRPAEPGANATGAPRTIGGSHPSDSVRRRIERASSADRTWTIRCK